VSRSALFRFLQDLTQQMGAQMQLCCGRALGNLPTTKRNREGRLA
jgi:hypothetical protein